jgi:hypothetical protein
VRGTGDGAEAAGGVLIVVSRKGKGEKKVSGVVCVCGVGAVGLADLVFECKNGLLVSLSHVSRVSGAAVTGVKDWGCGVGENVVVSLFSHLCPLCRTSVVEGVEDWVWVCVCVCFSTRCQGPDAEEEGRG